MAVAGNRTVWSLLVNDKKPVGDCFEVDVPSTASVDKLKKAIKAEKANDLANIDADRLIVWRCKDVTIGTKRGEALKEHVKNFDFSNASNDVDKVDPEETVEGLLLSQNEKLIVQVPAPAPEGEEMESMHDPQRQLRDHTDIFLQVQSATFAQSDLITNKIYKWANEEDLPSHAKTFIQMLERNPVLPPDRSGSLQVRFDGTSWSPPSASQTRQGDPQGQLTSEDPEVPPTLENRRPVGEEEALHYLWTENKNWPELWNQSSMYATTEGACKEMLVHAFATAGWKLHIVGSRDSNTVVTTGTQQWDNNRPIVIKLGNSPSVQWAKWTPKPDVTILRRSHIYYLMEVNSGNPAPVGRMADDILRLFLASTFLVRFSNKSVSLFKEKKNFVLVSDYIYQEGTADRYIFFQKRGDVQVYHHVRRFLLVKEDDRVHFAKELHNLIEHEKEKSVNAEDAVDNYRKATEKLKYPTLRTKKRTQPHDGHGNDADQPDGKHRRADGDQQEDQGGFSTCTVTVTDNDINLLCSKGYSIATLAADDDKGELELEPLVETPPHVLEVYRSTDGMTRLVAKKIWTGSPELAILSCLERDKNKHIVFFEDLVESPHCKWLILPRLLPLAEALLAGDTFALHSGNLCVGLIDGLDRLHGLLIVHRDLTPDNILFDPVDKCAKITDFDCAMRLSREDETIKGFVGTEGWTAPEVGPSSYSPILADRWACGKLVCYLLTIFRCRDYASSLETALKKFAAALQAHAPHCRPKLASYQSWILPPSPMTTVDTDVDSNCRRRQVHLPEVLYQAEGIRHSPRRHQQQVSYCVSNASRSVSTIAPIK